MILYDNESFEEKEEVLKKRSVMELTTIRVFCVTPVQPIGEVAEILSSKKIKKMPIVTADGALVGIARRSTIMRYIFNMLFNSDDTRISNI